MEECKKNKLTIYLIKEGKEEKEIIDDFNFYKEKEEDITYYGKIPVSSNVKIFYKLSEDKVPSWVDSFFGPQYNLQRLFTSNAKLVVLVRHSNRYFVVAFGYGKNLVDRDTFQEDFGIKTVLNTLNRDRIRKVDKTFIGGNQKSSSEQLPKNGSIDDLGLDVERDLVSKVTGTVITDRWFKGIITGGVGLTVTAEIDLSNIETLVEHCYKRYQEDKYKNDFDWIDNIALVKDSSLINTLDNKMVDSIKKKEYRFWTAVPEIIQWENCGQFMIQGLKEKLDDIHIDNVLKSFKNKLEKVSQLKSKQVQLYNSEGTGVDYHWSVYKCLYGEIENDNQNYCISNGKWYCINKSFRDEISADYQKTLRSSISFDDFKTSLHKSENQYSSNFVDTHNNDYILLDRKNVYYGGGRSQIEVCDIFSKDRELIHVKPYSGSSTLSHLFNQGSISFELLKSDPEFLEKSNEQIKKINENFIIKENEKDQLKVVYAIIQKDSTDLPNIPFFSKVALKHAKRHIQAMKGSVEIALIKKIEDK